jgi:outer membrane protein
MAHRVSGDVDFEPVASFHAENFYLFLLATGVTSRYEGNGGYRPMDGPALAAQFGNGFPPSTVDGAGYRKGFTNVLFVSAALAYGDCRDDEKHIDRPRTDYLKRMGKSRIRGSFQRKTKQVAATVRRFSAGSISQVRPALTTRRRSTLRTNMER